LLTCQEKWQLSVNYFALKPVAIALGMKSMSAKEYAQTFYCGKNRVSELALGIAPG
jgi:hypothetical protein